MGSDNCAPLPSSSFRGGGGMPLSRYDRCDLVGAKVSL